MVENIPPELGAEDLELYFESDKYSGGGETSSFQFTKASRRAVIVFDDPASKFTFSNISSCLSNRTTMMDIVIASRNCNYAIINPIFLEENSYL